MKTAWPPSFVNNESFITEVEVVVEFPNNLTHAPATILWDASWTVTFTVVSFVLWQLEKKVTATKAKKVNNSKDYIDRFIFSKLN